MLAKLLADAKYRFHKSSVLDKAGFGWEFIDGITLNKKIKQSPSKQNYLELKELWINVCMNV